MGIHRAPIKFQTFVFLAPPRITYYPITDAWVTRPERPKGGKDEVKRPEGPPIRSRGPEGPLDF